MNSAVILLLVFLGLVVLRSPVSVALLLAAIAAALNEDINLIVLAQQVWKGLDSFTMLAIPLFLLSGAFMEAGGIVERIAKFSQTLVGHIKGSLGHVTILCNMLLAGVSGSATADAAAVGGMFIPAMKKRGYSGELAAAINAASATMGPIIPPSLIMVVYAASAGVSTGVLFLCGVIPGILVGLTQMAIVYRYARKHGLGAAGGRPPFREMLREFRRCFPALLVPVIIIVGIVAGIFTATEAAMVAAWYCMLISLFLYRSIRVRNLPAIFVAAALAAAPCLFCIASASVFGWMLAYLDIPTMLMDAMSPFITGELSLLVMLTLLFIVVGMFMDALPAIVIFQPIVAALTAGVGADSMHVAIVISLVLCCGLMTPPYGITLLLSAQIAQVRALASAKVLLPFYIVFMAVVAMVILFPDLALWLPRLLMPTSFA